MLLAHIYSTKYIQNKSDSELYIPLKGEKHLAFGPLLQVHYGYTLFPTKNGLTTETELSYSAPCCFCPPALYPSEILTNPGLFGVFSLLIINLLLFNKSAFWHILCTFRLLLFFLSLAYDSVVSECQRSARRQKISAFHANTRFHL